MDDYGFALTHDLKDHARKPPRRVNRSRGGFCLGIPAFGFGPCTAGMWGLIHRIEGFQYDATERLSYDRYEALNEYVTKLATAANLIDAEDPLAYVYQAIEDAEWMLRHIQEELAGSN